MKGYKRETLNFTLVGADTKTIIIPSTHGSVVEFWGSSLVQPAPFDSSAFFRRLVTIRASGTNTITSIDNSLGNPILSPSQVVTILGNGNVQIVLTGAGIGYTTPITFEYIVLSIE